MSTTVKEDLKDAKGEGKKNTQPAQSVLQMFEAISEDVLQYVTGRIDKRVSQRVRHLEQKINESRPLKIEIPNFKTEILEGVQHFLFEKLLKVVAVGQPVMVVGPAGTGKSHAGEACAKALGLHFYAMSVGAQTSKSDLIGYMDANKNYVTTPFRLAYENGGVFLLDEIDAGNSNVLIQLNAALANGYMSFPDKMVRRHADFRFIASANTFGLGANRQYVGRNQLDAATLDRFVTIEWPIDSNVEKSLAIGHWGPAWLKVVAEVRKYVEDNELRIVVSPRATQRGALLLATKLEFNDVLHMALLGQFPLETKEKLHKQAWITWRQEIDKLGPEPIEEPLEEVKEGEEDLPDWDGVDDEADDGFDDAEDVLEDANATDEEEAVPDFDVEDKEAAAIALIAETAGWTTASTLIFLNTLEASLAEKGMANEVVSSLALDLEEPDKVGLYYELIINPLHPFGIEWDGKSLDQLKKGINDMAPANVTLAAILVNLTRVLRWVPSERDDVVKMVVAGRKSAQGRTKG